MDGEGILYDLSEFMHYPQRTGIQRVTFEILARWPPGRTPLVPVVLSRSGAVYRLPAETFGVIEEFFGLASGDPGRARQRLVEFMARAPEAAEPVAPERALGFLNVELFFNDWRPEVYHRLLDRMGERFFFLLYDFFPWLYPWWFPKGLMHEIPLMDFFRLARRASHVAFISEATRQDYLRRVVRRDRPTGPVLAMGGDGLGTRRPDFAAARRRFTAVGSIEPRKNLGPVLRAFASLWGEGVDARLTVVGRMNGLPADERRLFDDLLENEPRFEWRTNLDDGQVRDVITDSRATVFASRAEGFGIPPLESLSLGVPVIVYEGIPSVAGLTPHGQVRLAEPDAVGVRRAVLDLLDDEYARAKTEEIRGLHVPTWGELAGNLAAWVEGELGLSGAGDVAEALVAPLP
jgi:glycosyltransferase involved in cell wall biosynthesis